MNLNELDSFKLSDAVKFHKELNPRLWKNDQLLPLVKKQLLIIAEDFVEELGISGLDVVDVTVSGSNAAYSYTPHSDLDLHIIVNMSELHNDEVYRELFRAKKTLYNDSHDITVHGVPVELYVQDSAEPVVSLGEYSILHDKWIKVPKRRAANFDQNATKAKYEQLTDLISLAIKTKDPKRIDKTIALIRRYRKAGLDKGGEFSPENLAYKAIRTQGGIDDLYAMRDKAHSKELSIEEESNNLLDKKTLTVDELARKHGVKRIDIAKQLDMGIKVELEHTSNRDVAREIALDHIAEDPKYYDKLSKIDLEEAPRTFQSLVTPLEKLIQDYGYFTSFGTVHLDKQATTSDGKQQLLGLVQRLQKDSKSFNGLDKNKMEANRDIILNHIYQMMQYAIPILKKHLPAEKWEAKRSQINSVLTAYNNARQINEASGYIPSAKEKNDPRFKTALTVDVKPDAIKKNTKAFNWKTSRAGIPPQARADGKIAESLMNEWKAFLAEDEQQELFPGYDKEHKQQRLDNWLQASHAWDGHKPRVFYHATTKDFDTFNTHGTGFASALGMAFEVERHGSFFAVDPKFAEAFIEKPDWPGEYKEGGRVIPVYLSVQNPIDLRDNNLSYMLRDEETVEGFKQNNIDLYSIYRHFNEFDRWELFDGPEGGEFVENLQKLGFDGAIINELIPNNNNAKSGEVWVVFNPNQVKSIYNRGSFSPDDPRLMKESSEPKIDAHRVGDTIWINYFEVPVKGKGLGTKEYEKFERSLPKDIKTIRLVASDAGYGPTHDFWDRMGFDYAYPDDDNEMVKILKNG